MTAWNDIYISMGVPYFLGMFGVAKSWTNSGVHGQAKVRKCNVCRDWRMCELPLHIAVGNRE
jgi:hypothetical protein